MFADLFRVAPVVGPATSSRAAPQPPTPNPAGRPGRSRPVFPALRNARPAAPPRSQPGGSFASSRWSRAGAGGRAAREEVGTEVDNTHRHGSKMFLRFRCSIRFAEGSEGKPRIKVVGEIDGFEGLRARRALEEAFRAVSQGIIR